MILDRSHLNNFFHQRLHYDVSVEKGHILEGVLRAFACFFKEVKNAVGDYYMLGIMYSILAWLFMSYFGMIPLYNFFIPLVTGFVFGNIHFMRKLVSVASRDKILAVKQLLGVVLSIGLLLLIVFMGFAVHDLRMDQQIIDTIKFEPTL